MIASPEPNWDTTVLDQPIILDLPDRLPADTDHCGHFDPRLALAVAAMTAQLDGDHAQATRLVGKLGRAGIVAIRASSGTLEVRETLDGWQLIVSAGDPDPADLAVAAHLRASHLARQRHIARQRHRGSGQPR
ncbi:hypothetical protein [Frankia sp. Cj3]|uniref:hypothetical protein n=1 Tax=Frankia sp. Cj3 TaxID=2880976 RepID=UPI001EF48956|nr:hypothetical protein [Frankia sp. Cj3]